MLRLITAAFLCSVPPLALAQQPSPMSVPLNGKGGAPAGTIELTDTPNGVLIVARIESGKLPAGEHAWHIHETADCSDTEAFESAGEHHNPTGAEHGFVPDPGPHAGDLPNITVAEGGAAELHGLLHLVRFTEGDAPLLDADGSALVIHAGVDDYESQPSGNSGDRIACAEIKGN